MAAPTREPAVCGGGRVLTFDTTITVYNVLPNEMTGFDDYFRTTIGSCSWFSQINTAANATGLVYDKIFKVRIIEGFSASDKAYISPEMLANPNTHYTLAAGTIVVKGIGPPAPADGKAFAALVSKHSEAFKILNYRDNRRAGLLHLYAEGK